MASEPPPPRSAYRNLVSETLTLVTMISFFILILVMVVALMTMSVSLTDGLVRRSISAADEIAAILVDPLYNVDDLQARRIAEAMLSSGKVTGLQLVSTVSGPLFDRESPDTSRIPVQVRTVEKEGQPLGTVRLRFSDEEVSRTEQLFLLLAVLLVVTVSVAHLLTSRFLVRRRVERSLEGISHGIEAIAQGRYDETIPLTHYNDVNTVVHLLNDMAGRVEGASRRLKTMVEALTRSQRLLQTIFDSANEAMIGTDLEGRIIFFNRGAERILGYSAEEVVGRETPLLFHLPSEVDGAQREMELRRGRPVSRFAALIPGDEASIASEERSWTWVTKGGSTRAVRLTISRLDSGDDQRGYMGVARDETTLIEAEQRFRTIMEQAPVGILLVDGLAITYANPAFARMVGLAGPADAVGREALEFVHSEDQAGLSEFAQRQRISAQGPAIHCMRGLRVDGTVVILEAKVEILHLAGHPQTLVFVEDVTERRQVEEEIQELNRNLESKVIERTNELREAYARLELAQKDLVLSEKLTALGQLAAGIAHELNTPLGAITSAIASIQQYLLEGFPETVGFLHGLSEQERALFWRLARPRSEKATSPDQSHWEQRRVLEAELRRRGAEPARRIAEILLDLGLGDLPASVNEVLAHPRREPILEHAMGQNSALALTEVVQVATQKGTAVVAALRQYLSNQNQQQYSLVEVEKSIEMVLTLLQNKIRNQVRIEKHFSGTQVWGSGSELGQVWMNLITNGLQAMDYRGFLVLTTEAVEGHVVVSVTDSGKGIPEELKAKIFEPFFTTKLQGEGMGLGLDICRKIVENHRGHIEVESRPGQTTFRVTLPQAHQGSAT